MAIKKQNDGYIALVTALIVGVVSTVILVSLLVLGLGYSRSSQSSSFLAQARSLSNACAEDALRQLRANSNFTATNTVVSLGNGTCTYSLTNTGGNNRQINSHCDVQTVTSKLQINVTSLNPKIIISSWQEVI